MIGKPVTDTTLLQLVEASVDAPVTASDLSSHENTQFHRQCGLSFYALPAAELGGAGKQKCFAGFKMARAGIYGSKGYSGALPFGLVFADGPDAVREKMPATTLVNKSAPSFPSLYKDCCRMPAVRWRWR